VRKEDKQYKQTKMEQKDKELKELTLETQEIDDDVELEENEPVDIPSDTQPTESCSLEFPNNAKISMTSKVLRADTLLKLIMKNKNALFNSKPKSKADYIK